MWDAETSDEEDEEEEGEDEPDAIREAKCLLCEAGRLGSVVVSTVVGAVNRRVNACLASASLYHGGQRSWSCTQNNSKAFKHLSVRPGPQSVSMRK